MRTVLASRSEIVEYDRRQQSAVSGVNTDTRARHVTSSSGAWSQSAPDCYGCASASAQQCVTLLRVLATNEHAKPLLVAKGIIRELIMYNLRRGNVKSRKQVHSLISQLITNNREASLQLNELLLSRITGAINHHGDDLPPSAVACEMQLLTSMINVRDDLWQLRLRAVMQLFQMSVKIKSPAVVENITLPCVHMLRKLVAPEGREDPQPRSSEPNISVEAAQWMSGLSAHSFDSWAKRKGKAPAPTKEKQQADKSKKEIHELYLQEKYAAKWKKFVLNKKKLAPQKIQLSRHSFLRTMLFCQTSSSMRQAACDVITSLAKNTSRKPQVLDLLTSYLDQLGTAGEAAAEFLALYQEQIRPKQWRVYLASRGLLPLLGSLIQMEIAKLAALEEKTLNLHLQQGYALKELTELLSEMVQVYYVRQHYKGKLVGTVLNSYLSLRRLVIQRTNLVDDAQDILLELLEELTTGTESETRSFMAVCIEAIKKQETSDLKTPQFIFERLANIIYPEESDTSEFFLSLDKDPLQEDFLQGRMVGNPYSSNEAGLGPLMRDVKNKICRDCDLIALLEDDSGMELLINNKIIALDLPVRDVYKKIWLPNHTEDDAMHVVYRMRGLLGEATEDIVERLDSDKADQNDEEVYKLASVLSECGGLEVMLMRLESVKSLLHGRQLVEVILKLLSHAIKLKVNRRYLARPQLNTLNILLGSLNLGLQAGEDGVLMVEQLLKIMGSILQEAAADKTNQDVDAEYLTGDKEKLTLLLQQIDSEFVQGHTSILQGILRIIPFLSFGDPDLMQMLIDHFISTLDFEKYDCSHSDDEKVYLNCFCEIVSGIHFNTSGSQLKDLMVKNQILQNATSYLNAHIPNHKNFESEDWKAFKSRPGVPFCLRMLTGLCSKHTTAQELVGDVAIPALHRLEQISSEEGIGPHAENVLEALQEHPEVAKRIKEVRRQTRDEKKKKAMAIRQKQLGSLGMKTNDKGQQVVTKSAILQQISDLVEETGLTCIICREGYKFEPKKVLGIYTYTRRCPLEEFEQKSRKTQGYSTVSHFNVVHYECHTSAVRMARGREEWDSALLQNTNTKCNGLLPLWGAQVPEAAFASCLARHNTYIQEATGQREPGFYSTVHDLKLLLLRFANERSFSEETGGGGRQSNINLIPYLIHTGLYVVNSTRNQGREERTVSDFLAAPLEKWVESSYEVDGPLYVTCVVPFIHGSKKWNEIKIKFLKRLLVTAQARNNSQNSISKLTDREVKEFRVYKPYVMFWALVHLIITVQFKHVPAEGGCAVLANYIRNNDTQLRETGENTLTMFQDDLVVCESFDEFVDVMQLHSDIGGDATSFIKETLDSLPA
uniref:E3 ubiquitin-protein ligase UBR4-like n=1 Tax=Phallusia mammillata TaxID=59560 RepID=A0A6F9DWT9_9ASCI|nr:E3 ubiquitin-protein ligase UBR4-like [Phallusia mammillata]